MPVCISEHPQLVNGSKRLVWQALYDQLGPDDGLVTNLRLTDHVKDHEIDIAVAMPSYGVAVLEVKGSGVRHDGQRWLIPRNGREERAS